MCSWRGSAASWWSEDLPRGAIPSPLPRPMSSCRSIAQDRMFKAMSSFESGSHKISRPWNEIDSPDADTSVLYCRYETPLDRMQTLRYLRRYMKAGQKDRCKVLQD